MNKLQLALVAVLLSLGFSQVEAWGGRCGKRGCAPKCAPKCAPVCDTQCEDYKEECTKEECYTVKYPRRFERTCHNYTTCCTTKKCDKDGWIPQPCQLKVICDGNTVEEVEL